MKTKITEEEFKVLLSDGVKDFSQYRMEVGRLVCSWNNLTALPVIEYSDGIGNNFKK
jgi:hypothetical protein